VMAELLDYCLSRAESKYKKVWQIDTTERTAEQTAELILQHINSGEEIYEACDWSKMLEDWLRKGYIQ
jgi:broad-specificity NMP kinase